MTTEPAKPEIINITVKKWTIKDKYPCPKCSKKLGYPDYTCIDCNVKIKPKMNF